MIQKLTIKNFQSHKNSELVFSEGINIVTGNSNNGKTAVLRALNWVINNRPQGLAFKSNFSDKKDVCSVALTINNQEIIREKNNSINQYKIGSSLFDTIGNDVPSEVISAINLSDINIQGQFEKHFLVTESSGEVGRTINKIVKLDDIDALISSISSKITSTNKELDIKKQDLDKLYISLEKFKDFDKIEELVNQIIDHDSNVKEMDRKVKLLDYILQESVRIENIIKNLEDNYDTLETEIRELEGLWLNYNTNIEMSKNLTKLVAGFKDIEHKIEVSETVLNHVNLLQEVEENVIKYATLSATTSQLNNLISNWNKYFEIIKKIEKLLEKEELNFKQALKEAGFCPLCGSKF